VLVLANPTSAAPWRLLRLYRFPMTAQHPAPLKKSVASPFAIKGSVPH